MRRSQVLLVLIALTVLAFTFVQTAAADSTNRFVAWNSTTAAPPYTNWITAASNIQDAISTCSSGDVVWVTNGTYEVGGITNSSGGLLTNRVAIYKAITVRSANNDPTNTIIKGTGPLGDAAIRCVFMTNNSSLIGFMLTNGATTTINDNSGYGGGIYGISSSCIASNCIIAGNSAQHYGGGAYHVSLYNCAIIGNTANNGGGMYSVTLYNCTIAGNSAINGGGGGNCNLFNCTIVSNTASNKGGGLNGQGLWNCIIVGNTATNYGGGATACNSYNSTFVGNTATTNVGGGTHDCTLYNCISWDNNKVDYNSVTYFSCGVGYTNGGSVSGNITNNPLFVDSTAGNYRLESHSPCVNAGTNGSWTTSYPYDLDGRQRVRYGTVDMGAYETIYNGTIYRFGF